MSVVAWDGKILAADKQQTKDDFKFRGKKIIIKDNKAVGTVGNCSLAKNFANWIFNGADPESFEEAAEEGDYVEALYVEISEGVPVVLLFNNIYPTPLVIEEPFFAIGSGADVAMGALTIGCNAEEAVLAASQHIASCGMGVDKDEF